MIQRILRDIGGLLLTLLLASGVSFIVLRVLPGDPAKLIVGPLAGESAVEAVRAQLGIDQPLLQQYLTYLGNFVTGNWGFSYSNGADVSTVIASRLPATLELAVYAFLFAVIGAILAATLATYFRGLFGGVVKGVSLIGLGSPPFWLGMILLIVFAMGLGWFPGPSGRLSSFLSPPPAVTGFYTIDGLLAGNMVVFSDALAHLVLPAVALGLLPWAFLTRLLSANINDNRGAPYITVVRAKGVSKWAAHWRHTLPNSLLPTISSTGVILASLITGSVLVEQIFVWPGIGQVLVQGIQRQDFAVVQTFILLSAAIYVIANVVVDIVLEIADPRLRVKSS